MNFDYCLQTNEKTKKHQKRHSTVINKFYFLVLEYSKSWLNLMIVSMFVLENRQTSERHLKLSTPNMMTERLCKT